MDRFRARLHSWNGDRRPRGRRWSCSGGLAAEGTGRGSGSLGSTSGGGQGGQDGHVSTHGPPSTRLMPPLSVLHRLQNSRGCAWGGFGAPQVRTERPLSSPPVQTAARRKEPGVTGGQGGFCTHAHRAHAGRDPRTYPMGEFLHRAHATEESPSAVRRRDWGLLWGMCAPASGFWTEIVGEMACLHHPRRHPVPGSVVRTRCRHPPPWVRVPPPATVPMTPHAEPQPWTPQAVQRAAVCRHAHPPLGEHPDASAPNPPVRPHHGTARPRTLTLIKTGH